MDRHAFLTRIREAAAAGRAFPVALNPEATEKAAYVGGGDDPVATFLREWIAVGGNGLRVADAAELEEYLQQILHRHSVRSALCWKHPVLERLGIPAFLASQNVETRLWDALESAAPAERWEQTFSADLGITSVDWAIAETGSLAVRGTHGQGRAVSLLPPVHVAIIEPWQIVPDLFDLFEILSGNLAELPSALTLITGPSKTGDIQLQLTTGVHGPGEVHAVVVG